MELNLKQKRLLELLSINCRFSNKDMGKIIGLSEDSVDYQINKLINEEGMAKFNVQFNYLLLGYKQHHMWIKLKSQKVDYNKLNRIKGITSINSSYGKYDLQLIIVSKTKKNLTKIIKQIKNSLSISKYYLSEFKDFYKRFTNVLPTISVKTKIPTNKKNFVYKLNKKLYANADKNTSIIIDDVDKKIISELLKNPRASYQQISKNTNLNHETIRYRIKHYVETRFINNFGLIHDFKKHGLYTTYLLLKLKKFNENELKNLLSTNEHVFYSAKLEGEYNCIIYLVSSNPNDLGKNFDQIMKMLNKSIIEVDLLFLENIHKYVQFPEETLN